MGRSAWLYVTLARPLPTSEGLVAFFFVDTDITSGRTGAPFRNRADPIFSKYKCLCSDDRHQSSKPTNIDLAALGAMGLPITRQTIYIEETEANLEMLRGVRGTVHHLTI